jgi:hypothetical protein
MALPGFTAEASVGPTTQVYRVQDRYGAAEAAQVHPQLNGGEWDEGLWDEDFGDEGLEEDEAMEMAGDEDTEVGVEV